MADGTAHVVVTDIIFPTLDPERAAAEGAGASFAAHRARTDAEVAGAVAGARMVCVQFAKFGPLAAAAVAPGASVVRYGVGYDNIDLDAARGAGLRVGYVPDYCTAEVADHAATAVLTMLRKLVPLDASVRRGEWAAVANARPLPPFDRTTVGFFGLGAIGREVLARLRPFGFRFVVSDPGLSGEEAGALEVERVSPEDLLARADAITLHAPATDETTGFFDAAAFGAMKETAVLVNTARGALVNEADLAAALRSGAIGGAALDVFAAEPLPEGSPLREAPNLILTPHAAWYSDAAIGRLQSLMAEDIARALRGEGPRRPVPGFEARGANA